jgi:hypothetical protein
MEKWEYCSVVVSWRPGSNLLNGRFVARTTYYSLDGNHPSEELKTDLGGGSDSIIAFML